MIELRVTPTIKLTSELLSQDTESVKLHELFIHDWREGLFQLATQREHTTQTARYWKSFASSYITNLCHQSDNTTWDTVPLSPAQASEFYLNAPPMTGGEYLTTASLQAIWQALDAWIQEASKKYDTLSAFLSACAPQWNHVGRVCFHLAENKKNPNKPFAFLATYSTGLGNTGQVKHVPIGQALKEYAGQQNKTRLINLLKPVMEASKHCLWVKALIDSNRLYKPQAWSAEAAYRFLLSVPTLEQSGLTVRVPNWWKKRSKAHVSVTIGQDKRNRLGLDTVLDFDVSVALGETQLSKEDLRSLLQEESGLIFFKGQWIELDQEKLQQAIGHWDAVKEDLHHEGISFIEGMRLLAGAPGDLKGDTLEETERTWVHIQAGDAMRELLKQLRAPAHIEAQQNIKGLNATLRPYQEEGVRWLTLLSELGLGACLADDMGLGKTIQLLSLLLYLKQTHKQKRPSLLVVPASLLGNWKQEADTFAPSLSLLLLHPSEHSRAELKAFEDNDAVQDFDLVVTTYTMLTRQTWLHSISWNLIVLDEAQAIKNPGTKQTKAVKSLQGDARIALTGTPIENRLGDLWSLFDFINPGLLGSSKVFKNFLKTLQSQESYHFAPLRRLVSPYILRRMKTDPYIVPDLPDKTEIIRHCQLTKKQVKLYKGVIDEMEDILRADIPPEGIQRKGLVLQSIVRLKQLCNHPSQLTGDGDYSAKDSGKFSQLTELCEEIAARQEKVLIFTQFREIIDALETHIAGIFGRPGLVLHGGTSVKKRKTLVKLFQSEEGSPFFILSLKAGGTGLNLTAANHVIHFDRWWNPAIENQATDRAFRIGQHKNVLVHKFVTKGTIEERIDALIKEKQSLAKDLLSKSEEVNITELSDDDLLNLMRLDVSRATF